MTIGLVDIDGHAKKKKWGATIYPNLALAKIARYHRERGDRVEWAIPFFHYDRIYMSKVFNFSPDDLTCYDADEIIRGGTGYDINSQLPDEIDRLQPDYSIYPNVPEDTAYGFLTRGCPNKCPWCVVPRKEGAIRPYMDVDEIAIEGRRKLVLMDNNILAAGDYAVRQLEKIIERGYRVDFNQALDARLVSPGFAKLLARVKWLDNNHIRFGCDTHAQIAECDKKVFWREIRKSSTAFNIDTRREILHAIDVKDEAEMKRIAEHSDYQKFVFKTIRNLKTKSGKEKWQKKPLDKKTGGKSRGRPAGFCPDKGPHFKNDQFFLKFSLRKFA